MKQKLLLFAVVLLLGIQSYAQTGVAINATGTDAASSAMLDVSSTAKGLLVPRMTSVQRSDIASPAIGLLVFQTDAPEGFYYYNAASEWVYITNTNSPVGILAVENGGTGTTTGSITGTNALTFAAGGSNQNVTLTPSGTGSIVLLGNTGINTSGSSPDSNAILDLSSTSKGFLPPRMTSAQKGLISNPPVGLMIWCTNCGISGELQVYNGTIWTNLIGGATSGTIPGAPTIGTATAGDGQASVSFAAPASNGGSEIISYTATSTPGSFTGTLTQAGSGTITVTGLTNGTAYTFTVKATNANGTGAASDPSNSVTPATVPGAPTGVSATAGNAQASVSFTAPASNGGSPITSYTATSTPGNFTGTLTQAGSGTITVTGLTNGTAYTFTVNATNAIGTGAASATSNSVTYAIVPGAPTIGTATAGNAQASVPYTAPASNGGSAITSYTATSSPGSFTGTLNQAASGTIIVTGLTNGTAYSFTVKATNAVGTGAASTVSNWVTPATVPDAPIIGTATAAGGQVSVTFTQPAFNGGSAITYYTATSSPGGITGTLSQAGSGTITVTGLNPATPYTFTVTATNAMGTSAASAASNSVSYATIPGAPTISTATAGNAQASVSFIAPASNGGSVITSYTATSTPGSFTGTLTQAGSGTITVTGLTNGTAYTFTVKATNAAGTGAASAASNSVTPATVPGAPTGVSATAGNAQATVSFTAPASNGGSAITSYTATSTPGSFTGTLTQAGSGTITVTGLTNGTAYTFTVKATNAIGTGAASATSNSVTYAIVPGAPTIGTATPGNTLATVSFTAPASNGGSAITSYTATSSPGSFTGTLNQAGSGTIIVTGLTNGTAYTFTVKATNAAGTGAASAASNSVNYTVPGVPTIGTATAGAGQASVPFTAPAYNGGPAITSYKATSNPDNITEILNQAGSGTITVTGLTAGTSYTFTVKATNAAGTGAASAASNAVTPTFLCGRYLTDIRDGKLYTTVQIGTQCWMKQNLNVGTKIDSTVAQSNNGTIEKYCNRDLDANCTTYGGLYSWDEMMQYSTTQGIKGICPTGWHLPTDAEWTTLSTYLGGESVAGGKMKETGTAHWTTPNLGATNTSGFTGLPGGWRHPSGLYNTVGSYGLFWSSTEYPTHAWYRDLDFNFQILYRNHNPKDDGFSVRCVMD